MGAYGKSLNFGYTNAIYIVQRKMAEGTIQ
jgi:hypothetical protein